MFNQQPLPLDDEGFSFVETLIRNNMGKPHFAYSVYINKKNIPIIDRATDVEEFLNFIGNLHPFTQVIDITFKTNSSNAGKRLTLASPMLNGFDFEITQPLRNNTYTASQSDKREKEIAERAELRAQSVFMEKELRRREEEINRLQKEVKEKDKTISSLDNFSRELETMIKDMKKEAGKDNNNSLFKYAMQIEQAVPGLLGSVFGINRRGTTAASTLEGAPDEQSEEIAAIKQLFEPFSADEQRYVFKILARLSHCKDILPQLLKIVDDYLEKKMAQMSHVANSNPQPQTGVSSTAKAPSVSQEQRTQSVPYQSQIRLKPKAVVSTEPVQTVTPPTAENTAQTAGSETAQPATTPQTEPQAKTNNETQSTGVTNEPENQSLSGSTSAQSSSADDEDYLDPAECGVNY